MLPPRLNASMQKHVDETWDTQVLSKEHCGAYVHSNFYLLRAAKLQF